MNPFADLYQLHLLRPWWLLAALPAILLTLSLWRSRSGGGDWARAIAPELLQPLLEPGAAPARRRWLPLLLTGWLLATLALSGPAWQQLPQPVLQRSDALVIALDLSLSMLAQDVTPSRLQRARYKIQDVLEQRHEGTTALVAYAGSAHVVAPLTDDGATLANLLPALAPETMPLRGSDPAAAVKLAIELLRGAGEQRGRILLISDGIRERDIDAIANLLDARWQLSILGIGTLQGAPLPLDGGFARSSDGGIAVPTLSRAEFERLARRSDGRYRELSADNSDIDALLATTALDLDATRHNGDPRHFDQWHDRGALLALLLLPLAALLFRRGWLLLLPLTALPLTLLPAAPAQAWELPTTAQQWQQSWRDLWQRPDQQAARALDAGDAETAARRFEDPGWRGAAHYRAGDYDAAATDFADSREQLPGGIADYNRGNALARAGQLQQALEAYDAALRDNPALEDARANRELVEQLLQRQAPQQNQGGSSQQQNDESSDARQQPQNGTGQPSDGQHRDSNPSDGSMPPQSSPGDSDDESAQTPPAPDRHGDDQQQRQQGTASDDGDDRQRQAEPQSMPTEGRDDGGDEPASGTATDGAADDPEQQRERARTEQWLRQIPDDPGGLLQRKFLYEQRLRERDGETRAPDQPAW